MDISAELVQLFREELELCKIKSGDTVVIFTEPRFGQPYPSAVMGAATELGAEVFEVMIPAIRKGISEPVTKSLKLASIVVDMTQIPGSHSPWLYSKSHNQVLAAGVKTLMVFQPQESLRRLFPDPASTKRVRAGAAFFDDVKTIRLKSDAGTDLTCSKEGRMGGFQQGFSDEPGRWDHWPSAQVACAPVEGTANGRLVLNTGDWVVNFGRMISQPVELTLADGRVTKVNGGPDAVEIEEYFRSHDSDSRGLAHIGWGCEHRAVWGASVMDVESYYANCLIAFGSNFFKGPAKGCGLGGKNFSNGHMDIGMRNTEFWADDVLVTKKGKIVYDKVK